MAALIPVCVVASGDDSSNYVYSVLDGNPSTRWGIASTGTETLVFDLGQTGASITGVTLVWEAAYAASYAIAVSNDNSSWTTIYTTTTGAGGTDTLTGLSGSGRYVRLRMTANGPYPFYSLYSVDISGTAGTSLRQVPSSVSASDYDPLYPPAGGTDYDFTTRWGADNIAYPHTFTADMGTVISVDQIDIQWELASATSFDLDSSTNGSTWTNLASGVMGSRLGQFMSTPGASGRYFRITGNSGAFGNYMSFWEISFLAAAAGGGGGGSPTPGNNRRALLGVGP